MYSFARRPRWLLSHALVVALIVAMVLLGFWQLNRLDDRRTRNAEITARSSEPVVSLEDLVTLDDDYGIGAALAYRMASATGIYDASGEVLVRNRTLEGRPGYWVLTPLTISDGVAVLVNRGWVPVELDDAPPLPPQGEVVVIGTVQATRTAAGIQSEDSAEGVLEFVSRPDLARIDRQLAARLLPVYLQLESQDPAGDASPIAVPRPVLDEGPHFGYAMQWFIFTAIAIGGYPLVLRRVARAEGGDHRRSDVPDEYL